jgi:hypothetical protein
MVLGGRELGHEGAISVDVDAANVESVSRASLETRVAVSDLCRAASSAACLSAICCLKILSTLKVVLNL